MRLSIGRHRRPRDPVSALRNSGVLVAVGAEAEIAELRDIDLELTGASNQIAHHGGRFSYSVRAELAAKLGEHVQVASKAKLRRCRNLVAQAQR